MEWWENSSKLHHLVCWLINLVHSQVRASMLWGKPEFCFICFSFEAAALWNNSEIHCSRNITLTSCRSKTSLNLGQVSFVKLTELVSMAAFWKVQMENPWAVGTELWGFFSPSVLMQFVLFPFPGVSFFRGPSKREIKCDSHICFRKFLWRYQIGSWLKWC